jgi:hypothetical protein
MRRFDLRDIDDERQRVTVRVFYDEGEWPEAVVETTRRRWDVGDLSELHRLADAALPRMTDEYLAEIEHHAQPGRWDYDQQTRREMLALVAEIRRQRAVLAADLAQIIPTDPANAESAEILTGVVNHIARRRYSVDELLMAGVDEAIVRQIIIQQMGQY